MRGGDICGGHFLSSLHAFEEVSIYGSLIYQFLDDIFHYKAIFERMAQNAVVVAEVWFLELGSLFWPFWFWELYEV